MSRKRVTIKYVDRAMKEEVLRRDGEGRKIVKAIKTTKRNWHVDGRSRKRTETKRTEKETDCGYY